MAENEPVILTRNEFASDEAWARYLSDPVYRRSINKNPIGDSREYFVNLSAVTRYPRNNLPALEDIDYGEDAPKPPAQTALTIKDIGDLCVSVRKLDDQIQKGEELLKDLKERRRRIVEGVIPDAMQESGLTTLTLSDGTVVTVKEVVQTSIRADLRPQAWQWLRENGHRDILKNQVTVTFTVGEEKQASEFAARVTEQEKRPCAVEVWAEPATVRSVITKRLERNEKVDRELFGVRTVKEAKFKTSKSDDL